MSGTQNWDALSDKFRQEFEHKIDNLSWKIETQEGSTVVYRSVHDGVTVWKCEAVLEAPKTETSPTAAVQTVFEAYYEWVHRLQWDKAFHPDSGQVLQLADRRTLDYSRTLPALGGVISPRDFVDLREWAWADDAHTVISAWGASVTHKDRPEARGVVRGHNYPCGTRVMVPAGGSEEESGGAVHVTLLWQSDIKGWVPARAVDQAMGQQMLMTITGLRAYLARA